MDKSWVYMSKLNFYLSWTIGHRFWRTLIQNVVRLQPQACRSGRML